MKSTKVASQLWKITVVGKRMNHFRLATDSVQELQVQSKENGIRYHQQPHLTIYLLYIIALWLCNTTTTKKTWVLFQWDKGDKTKILPEISFRLKPGQNKPSQKEHSIFKKKRTKSDFSNKVISLPSPGRIIQHKVNCLELNP